MAGLDDALVGRLVGSIRAGMTIAEAARDVDVPEPTVKRWLVRGRKEEGSVYARLAGDVDAFRAEVKEPLGRDDLVPMLEVAARRGSVQAIKLLLERPWEKKSADKPEKPVEPKDPFANTDQLAERRTARRTA